MLGWAVRAQKRGKGDESFKSPKRGRGFESYPSFLFFWQLGNLGVGFYLDFLFLFF